jgi:hypothetical protein
LRSITERLRRFAEAENIDLTVARDDLALAVRDAITVALRDIALTDLLDALGDSERDVLMQVAVSTIPVGTAMLADILDTVGDIDAVLRRLARFALLNPVEGSWFVERWTAEGLRAVTDPAQWRTRNRAAAARRLQAGASGTIDLADAMEAVRNLIAADELDAAAGRANSICAFLKDRRQPVALAAFAGECLAHLPLVTVDARLIAQAEADANLALGFTAATYRRWVDVTDTLTTLAEAEPDRAVHQRDLSVSYERLAMHSGMNRETARALIADAVGIRVTLHHREPNRVDLTEELATTSCQQIMINDDPTRPGAQEVRLLLQPLVESGRITAKGRALLAWLDDLGGSSGS